MLSKILHVERIRPIIDLWFPPDWDRASPTPKATLGLWWGVGLSQEEKKIRDDDLKNKFLQDMINVKKGEYETWLDSKDGLLAYVLICDQFSRCIFRDSAECFSFDYLTQKAVQNFLAEKPGTNKLPI